LREDLIQLLAELEAGLDFVEEDIQFISQAELQARLDAAAAQLVNLARQMELRHVAVELKQVVLIGRPNVGKSSLFNAIVKLYGASDPSNPSASAPALVSPQCGTTRDYLTATIVVGGLQCELVDTAGVGAVGAHHATPIDAAAQAVALGRIKRAALRAYCVETTRWQQDSAITHGLIDNADYDLIVVTKLDLANSGLASPRGNTTVPDQFSANRRSWPLVFTSCRTGEGLDAFCSAVRTLLARGPSPRPGGVLAATAARCHESIRLAADAIRAAADLAQQNVGNELVAAELRLALAELGKVVGAVYTDDLLERIFTTFCIGK
jgi:tRNA modification GTPase